MNHITAFLTEEDGMEIIEVVLIVVILITLVAAFSSAIKTIVETAIKNTKEQANGVHGMG